LAERPDAGLSAKDITARKKAEEKARKEEEKAMAAAEKQKQREATETQRMWTGVAKSLLVPIARNILGSLFKRR